MFLGGGWTCISGTTVSARNLSSERLQQVVSLHQRNNEYFKMLPGVFFIISDLSEEINYLTESPGLCWWEHEHISMCLETLCDHGDRSHQEKRGDQASVGCSQGSLSSVTLTAKEDLSQLLL